MIIDLHVSDQRQRYVKHAEKYPAHPKRQAIVDIFKNYDSPLEAAMSGWMKYWIDFDQKKKCWIMIGSS